MEKSNLELIHKKFKHERCCLHCGGYFLSPKNPKAEYCPMCIRDGRDTPAKDVAKDIVHQDVNIGELKEEVAQLKKIINDLTKDKVNVPDEEPEEETPIYKSRICPKCGKEFIPGSPAQKICHDCRAELIS